MLVWCSPSCAAICSLSFFQRSGYNSCAVIHLHLLDEVRSFTNTYTSVSCTTSMDARFLMLIAHMWSVQLSVNQQNNAKQTVHMSGYWQRSLWLCLSLSIPGVLLVLLCGLVSSCPLFFLLEVRCRLGRNCELFMGGWVGGLGIRMKICVGSVERLVVLLSPHFFATYTTHAHACAHTHTHTHTHSCWIFILPVLLLPGHDCPLQPV